MEEDVFELDVPVDDLFLVAGAEAVDDLLQIRFGLILRKPLPLHQAIHQAALATVLNEHQLVIFALIALVALQHIV